MVFYYFSGYRVERVLLRFVAKKFYEAHDFIDLLLYIIITDKECLTSSNCQLYFSFPVVFYKIFIKNN